MQKIEYYIYSNDYTYSTLERIENFINSDLGGLVAFLSAGAVFLAISGIFLKRVKLSVKAMTYSGLALSVAFMLSFISLYAMPQGGSITPMSMFFVAIIGFWFGPAFGMAAGVAYGFLQVVQGAWFIHPVQFLLDYPLAFGMLGLTGFFWKMRAGLYIGFIVACVGRFIMSALAGWIYWIGVDTPGSLWASMLYNGSYVFPEMLLTLVVISIPAVRHGLNHLKSRVNTESAAA
jgi:thiamine transporter